MFFWGFSASLIAWCALGSIVVVVLRKKGKQLEKAAAVNTPHEILNPLFELLIDEYKLDRLDRLTKNSFFQSWKLSSDDLWKNENGKVFLTLVFTKNSMKSFWISRKKRRPLLLMRNPAPTGNRQHFLWRIIKPWTSC